MNKLEILQNKIADLTTAERRVKAWQLKSRKVVFTNGCFDLLHPGHIASLAAAADAGNILVVGLNADTSVKELKGESRPIYNQAQRATMLAAIEIVDLVVIFDTETPIELITALKPDVLAKGGDYALSEIVGADVVMAYGGEVRQLPMIEGLGTTNIIKKITEA